MDSQNDSGSEKAKSLHSENSHKSNRPPKHDKKYKMIIIGSSGVGKTSLIYKALKNEFTPNLQSTLGFEYNNIIAKINDKKILLQTWDLCGQEIFHSIMGSFYKRSNLIILVYAIDDRESFNNLEFWLGEIRTYSNPDTKIVLVGNKIDLNSQRAVTFEEGKDFFTKNTLDLFFESSAKEGTNASDIFTESVKMLYEIDQQKKINNKGRKLSDDNKEGFYLNETNEMENTGKSCEECY